MKIITGYYTQIIKISILLFFLSGVINYINAQWVHSDNGLTNGNVTSIISTGSTMVAGTQGGGVFVSIDGGASWQVRNNGLAIVDVRALAAIGSNLFAGTSGGGVYFSSDFGVNWVQRINGLNSLLTTSFAVNGTTIYAGTLSAGGVYRSTDNGVNWKQVNSGLGFSSVYSLLFNGTDLFAGTSNPNCLYRTTINDTIWQAVSIGISQTDIVSALNINGINIFAGTSTDGIRRSTNYGANWQAVNNGFTLAQVNCFASVNSNLFAGMNLNGVNVTTNNGANWTAINSGLPGFMNVNALLVFGTNLFAGGVGYSIYKRPLSQVVSVNENRSSTPENFVLYDAYPNPFNPSTKIKFDVPLKALVKITISDITGREVSQLVNELFNAGSYEVNWNASDFSSGIYFYRLSTDKFTDTKKMILIK